MSILSELHGGLKELGAFVPAATEAPALLATMRQLDDDGVVAALRVAADMRNAIERVLAVGSAVVAERSTRERGRGGLAAVRGHKGPVELVQAISGGTRADARRAVRIGESLVEAEPTASDAGATSVEPAPIPVAWHEPLRAALFTGAVTVAQHDAIHRGLGEPPVDGPTGTDRDPEVVRRVWSIAAAQLVAEAAQLSVEELVRRARQVRDALDPAGVEERFARRYERRTIRTWIDADGGRHAHIDFDDEMGPWVFSMLAIGMRPRRGGPRFMTDKERAAAESLVHDPRTNEQLQYDLFMSVLRAGALANASDVFGARQPGVRMIVVNDLVGPRDAFGRMLAVGNLEDGGDALPGSVIDRALCETGSIEITVDSCGNPLDVGREQRLFTARQRIALAVRDGGCRWPGCEVPASYCESHHCDHWSAHHGKTDIDRGILLCRHHHMMLHNNGWYIRRDRRGEFMLHPPVDGSSGRDVMAMPTRSAVRWAWDPPPDRTPWRRGSAA